MNGQFAYGYSKLSMAVREMAIGEFDIRSRLIEANHLWLSALSIDNFPDDLKDDWRWIMKEMTKFGPYLNSNGEIMINAVQFTMSKRKNSTGRKIAEKIYELKYLMEKYK